MLKCVSILLQSLLALRTLGEQVAMMQCSSSTTTQGINVDVTTASVAVSIPHLAILPAQHIMRFGQTGSKPSTTDILAKRTPKYCGMPLSSSTQQPHQSLNMQVAPS